MSSEEKTLEAKIELLVNVAMLTIMTLMRLVKEKGPEAIGEPEMAQFNKVKESVEMAIGAVEAWQAEGDTEGNPVDLARLRTKLGLLIRKIEEWPFGDPTLDSVPPS